MSRDRVTRKDLQAAIACLEKGCDSADPASKSLARVAKMLRADAEQREVTHRTKVALSKTEIKLLEEAIEQAHWNGRVAIDLETRVRRNAGGNLKDRGYAKLAIRTYTAQVPLMNRLGKVYRYGPGELEMLVLESPQVVQVVKEHGPNEALAKLLTAAPGTLAA